MDGQDSEGVALAGSTGIEVATTANKAAYIEIDLAEPAWQLAVQALVQSLRLRHNPVIVVAEEAGWGVVPAYASGRLFRDRLGSVTRQISAIADAVYLVVSGYAVDVKQLGTVVPMGRDFTGT